MGWFDELFSSDIGKQVAGGDVSLPVNPAAAGGSLGSGTYGIDINNIMSIVAETTGLGGSGSAGPLSGDAWNNVASTAEQMGPPSYLAPAADEGFFDKLKREYDKNPLEFWKFGAGGLGLAMQSQDKRKAADAQARSALDQQNNADALKQAEIARYNASFTRHAPRKPTVKKPLTRLDGTQIYQNGIAKG